MDNKLKICGLSLLIIFLSIGIFLPSSAGAISENWKDDFEIYDCLDPLPWESSKWTTSNDYCRCQSATPFYSGKYGIFYGLNQKYSCRYRPQPLISLEDSGYTILSMVLSVSSTTANQTIEFLNNASAVVLKINFASDSKVYFNNVYYRTYAANEVNYLNLEIDPNNSRTRLSINGQLKSEWQNYLNLSNITMDYILFKTDTNSTTMKVDNIWAFKSDTQIKQDLNNFYIQFSIFCVGVIIFLLIFSIVLKLFI